MLKFALVISGAGYLDGAEINETVLAMLAMSKRGITWDAFSINDFKPSVNHITKKVEEDRNLLVESARITRTIQELDQCQLENYQALILPGGFGVAKNFSNLAEKGSSFTLHPRIEVVIKNFNNQSKPIGAICIAPALLAKIFPGAKLTLGSHNPLLSQAQEMICKADEIAIDLERKLVTTPAFMTDEPLAKIAIGIENLIIKIQELC
jgi:enhancing lycopene biosynthesis protein 2